jgi:hypothetical protein
MNNDSPWTLAMARRAARQLHKRGVKQRVWGGCLRTSRCFVKKVAV